MNFSTDSTAEPIRMSRFSQPSVSPALENHGRGLGTLLTSWTNLDGGMEGARLFRSTGDEGGKFCLKVPCASFRSSDRDDLFIIAGSKS